MMIKNIHTHTIRCGHACGSDIEYIEAAIRAGYKEIGFSDHGYREEINSGTYALYFTKQEAVYEDYFKTFRELREEYADRIRIYIGLEVEYIPGFFDEALEYYKKIGAEYLILGQHGVNSEDGSELVYAGLKNHSLESFNKYIDECIEAMDKGCFTYLAHPDLFNFIGDEEVYEERMKYFVSKIKEHNIPVEFNLHGFASHRNYPSDIFWKLAAENDIPAILGVDAHDPKELLDLHNINAAIDYLHSINVRIVDPVIKLLQ